MYGGSWFANASSANCVLLLTPSSGVGTDLTTYIIRAHTVPDRESWSHSDTCRSGIDLDRVGSVRSQDVRLSSAAVPH
jgi:hypothetical protein